MVKRISMAAFLAKFDAAYDEKEKAEAAAAKQVIAAMTAVWPTIGTKRSDNAKQKRSTGRVHSIPNGRRR